VRCTRDTVACGGAAGTVAPRPGMDDQAIVSRRPVQKAGLPEIRQKLRLATPCAASLDLMPLEPLSCDDVVPSAGG
jgi:hypothetical protein